MRPGQRVRVIGHPAGVTLRSPFGRVLAPDSRLAGFWLVWMDQPAVYHQADGTERALPCMREGEVNLVGVDDA